MKKTKRGPFCEAPCTVVVIIIVVFRTVVSSELLT